MTVKTIVPSKNDFKTFSLQNDLILHFTSDLEGDQEMAQKDILINLFDFSKNANALFIE